MCTVRGWFDGRTKGGIMGTMKRGLLAVVVGVACSWPVEAFAGGLLQPSDYTAIASTLTEAGNYSVNCNYGATPTITLPDGTVLNGVMDPTGQVAVFTFGSINISGGGTLTETSGSAYSVAILSQGNFTISNAFQASVWSVGFYGSGSGGSDGGSGGGGGYGGAGSAGGESYLMPGNIPVPGGAGGSTYGLTTAGLLAGSVGGQGFYGGGVGGGAIEFGAGGSLSLSSLSVSASGLAGYAAGGGGSGGEVAFLGSSVSLNVSVTAQGGQGGNGVTIDMHGIGEEYGNGGNGGGGLVQIQSNSINLGSSTFNLQGGGAGAGNGAVSEFNANGDFIGFAQGGAAPEPSSFVMAGIAAAAGLATALVRRHRRRRASRQRSIT